MPESLCDERPISFHPLQRFCSTRQSGSEISRTKWRTSWRASAWRGRPWDSCWRRWDRNRKLGPKEKVKEKVCRDGTGGQGWVFTYRKWMWGWVNNKRGTGGRVGEQTEMWRRKKKQNETVSESLTHHRGEHPQNITTQHDFANVALLSWHYYFFIIIIITRSICVFALHAVNVLRFYRVRMKDGLNLSYLVFKHWASDSCPRTNLLACCSVPMSQDRV